MKPFLTILLAIIIAESGWGASQKENAQAMAQKPLNYKNVVAFLKSTGLRATEVQPRCTVFFEGEWKSADIYNYCLIIAENSDEDVQVTFYLTDAHEMNWITEFIDSQLFNSSEKQALFGLLNRQRDARDKQIGRFKVDFHHWQPRHAEIIVFSFTPTRGG